MEIFKIIAFYIAQVVLALIIFPLVIKLVRRGGHLRKNFRGELIPSSAGIGFVLLFPLGMIAQDMIGNPLGKYFSLVNVPTKYTALYLYFFIPLLTFVFGFGFIGLIDDFFALREKGGITGHLRRLTKTGAFSSALFKAFFGIILSFYNFRYLLLVSGYELILKILIVCFAANAMNLFDVKPGRAVKGFWLFYIILIISGVKIYSEGIHIFIFVFIWTVIYSWWDFRCKAMMGDVGSNVLGVVLGLMIVVGLSAFWQIVALSFLIILHLIAEFYSISEVIEAVTPLRWLDNLGVRKNTNI